MQHIKNYMDKIEALISSKEKGAKKTKEAKGLLSSTKPSASSQQTELDIVASFVQSIRQSREEMKNG
jgi:hypothetical protein